MQSWGRGGEPGVPLRTWPQGAERSGGGCEKAAGSGAGAEGGRDPGSVPEGPN